MTSGGFCKKCCLLLRVFDKKVEGITCADVSNGWTIRRLHLLVRQHQGLHARRRISSHIIALSCCVHVFRLLVSFHCRSSWTDTFKDHRSGTKGCAYSRRAERLPFMIFGSSQSCTPSVTCKHLQVLARPEQLYFSLGPELRSYDLQVPDSQAVS